MFYDQQIGVRSKLPKLLALNDWHPVVLTSIISKCFETLIKDYICCVLPPHWTHYSLYTTTTSSLMMPLHIHYTLLCPTWKEKNTCCLYTTALHSTALCPPS